MAHEDNAGLHEGTLFRLQAEVKELRSRSVCPAPCARGHAGSVSPRRLGGPGRDDPPESLQDLAVVVGEWKDARRSEIQEEMASFLSQVKLTAEVAEVSVPFVRSTWARCNLAIPPNMSLNEARRLQTKIVQASKDAKLHSKLGGQQWPTPVVHATSHSREA